MVEYSERHHVPTVQGYRAEEEERKRQAASAAPSVPSKDDDSSQPSTGGGQEEKERIKAQMAPQPKPAAGFQAKGDRLVRDPVTGGQVKIAGESFSFVINMRVKLT